MGDSKAEISGERLDETIRKRLGLVGLKPLGWFETDGASALLIGNIGSSLWPAFSDSEEKLDGKPDPLNRWTMSQVADLVEGLGPGTVREVRYPFGDPVWPFQQYARQALGVEQSPLGLLIHPEYGLWFAFRAVLVFAHEISHLPSSPKMDHPCDTCIDKPCLNTCPIGAFTKDAYDYPACKKHVGSRAGETCFSGGCLARQACPVGKSYRNATDHQAFHMQAMMAS
ncbi:MAG: ferredoxin [Rhizobiaceae bacterium]|nr:ferredoxin [Hyphomicrobiales bacterium]NRB30418.1 ferredoxin [Rhizobiaceae bacterium]